MYLSGALIVAVTCGLYSRGSISVVPIIVEPAFAFVLSLIMVAAEIQHEKGWKRAFQLATAIVVLFAGVGAVKAVQWYASDEQKATREAYAKIEADAKASGTLLQLYATKPDSLWLMVDDKSDQIAPHLLVVRTHQIPNDTPVVAFADCDHLSDIRTLDGRAEFEWVSFRADRAWQARPGVAGENRILLHRCTP